MAEKEKADFKDNPLFQEVLREGLAIQHRFSAAPVYANTGKGGGPSIDSPHNTIPSGGAWLPGQTLFLPIRAAIASFRERIRAFCHRGFFRGMIPEAGNCQPERATT